MHSHVSTLSYYISAHTKHSISQKYKLPHFILTTHTNTQIVYIVCLYYLWGYATNGKNSICHHLKDGRTTGSDFVSRCFALDTQNTKEKEKSGPKSAYCSNFQFDTYRLP